MIAVWGVRSGVNSLESRDCGVECEGEDERVLVFLTIWTKKLYMFMR